MSVYFAHKHPPILMAKPFGNRLEIDTRHHRHARKVVPEVVEAYPRQFCFVTSSRE